MKNGEGKLKEGRRCQDPLARFLAYSIRAEGCWQWTAGAYGKKDRTAGYGRLKVNGIYVPVHRWAYEHYVGPIPEGMVIDHLCRNTRCVNPKHMEPVTSKENTRRGTAPSAQNMAKTHCKHGHEFEPENTRYYSKKYPNRRKCIICDKRPHRRTSHE